MSQRSSNLEIHVPCIRCAQSILFLPIDISVIELVFYRIICITITAGDILQTIEREKFLNVLQYVRNESVNLKQTWHKFPGGFLKHRPTTRFHVPMTCSYSMPAVIIVAVSKHYRINLDLDFIPQNGTELVHDQLTIAIWPLSGLKVAYKYLFDTNLIRPG